MPLSTWMPVLAPAVMVGRAETVVQWEFQYLNGPVTLLRVLDE
jgi:hypothetical protein